MTSSKDVVKFLRARRLSLGIPRKTVAAGAGVAERTLVAWECEERTPYLPNLLAWSRALQCELFLMSVRIAR